MENNILNLEEEYFKRKNQEAYAVLMNREFEKVIQILQEPLEKIESSLKDDTYCPQNIFEAGIFLNFLNKQVSQKDFAKINYYDFFLMSGAAKYNLELLEQSEKDYQKAIQLNPASSVARLQVLEIKKHRKEYDHFLEDVREFFQFAYRRTDIARAYRDVGYYLYDKKDYEMSLVAYYLSNVYEMSEMAINEIKHIEKEVGIDLESKAWLSEEMMGKFTDKYQIPLLPNEKLISLSLAMAEDATQKGVIKVAKFAYQIAYELTLEEKYRQKIEEIQELEEKN